MRTSEEIYHRVRWDPRFDPARFVLGINVRGAAPTRIPLVAFVPGGDIPWHRVLFVEADGEVVWDRASGVDRIDGSTAGRVREPRRLHAPYFTARTPHAWEPVAGWSPVRTVPTAPAPAAAAAASLRVLTWNTLWDRYHSDRIDTVRRRSLLLSTLERADADVIALQEVEPALLDLLLAAPWLRERYTIGTDPRGHDVPDTGLLLLSRLPVREAGQHAFSPVKGITAVALETAAGPLVVAVTHLTSDHADHAVGRRDAELADAAIGLSGVDGDLILVGDVNDGSSRPANALRLRDAWSELHGAQDRTPTFDPTVNPLAALGSLSGHARRLDRILLRGNRIQPYGAVLCGDRPDGTGLYASDHFGVRVDLTIGADGDGTEVLDVAPTSQTALAWLPPDELWPAVQRVRAEYDPQFVRWPPHVNVLFGFVPEADFDAAAPLIAAAVRDVAPFTARLAGVRGFQHPGSTTLWLDPAAGGDPGAWATLHNALVRRFPRCRGRVEGYTPHLTLGQTAHPDRLAAPLAARLGEATVPVGELVLLSRRGTEPMRPRATIVLGTGDVRWRSEVDSEPGPGAEPDPDEVVGRLIEAFPEGVVHVVGSRRLGCALPGGDLDLVAALPHQTELAEVATRVRAALPEGSTVRQLSASRVPGIRLRVGRLDVDLIVVATGGVDPGTAVARRAEIGTAAAIGLSAVSDADAILDAVSHRHAEFVRLARDVKAWAKVRGLDSAPHGGVPGVAWMVLAARTVRTATALAPDSLLSQFFGTWAGWDWRDAVALTGAPEPAGWEAMSVLTPSPPVRLCTEQVTRGWADLLTQELYRAWEIVEAGGADRTELLASPPMHRRHAAWAALTVRTVDGEALAATEGRMRGRLLALLAVLDEEDVPDAHAWPRPFATGPGWQRYAIGLGHTPPDADRLAALADRWAHGLPGVTVDWLPGCEVPTPR